MQALKNVMNSLDSMSTVKQTAHTIVRGQFQDVMTMFLRKDLNSLLGDNSHLSCKKCSYAINGEAPESLMIIEHALMILNRCLIQEQHALITDNTSQLFVASLIGNQTTDIEFGVSEVIEVCI